MSSSTFTNGSGAFAQSSDSDKLPNSLPTLVRTGTGLYTLTVPKSSRLAVMGAYVVVDSDTASARRLVIVKTETPATGVIELSIASAVTGANADPPSGGILKVSIRLQGQI